ncbi:DinB superfamily [Nocardia farcinica]|uniref:DinB superfamily n=1 Tax=Nocardia farcinica TaxID=37329 RepID=A0A449HAF8_NOCFR|nr:DinB family protein [Nocardia farcinica]VFA94918.1 DinB superfamily [Nocardia farcinica]
MAIVPDVKDWTWVLERPCPECGYDGGKVGYDEVPDAARAAAARVRAALDRPDARRRPTESTWSPLEYAAHVRDVCRIFAFRIAVATGGPAADPHVAAFDPGEAAPAGAVPTFTNWDQDATAVADRYDRQDPVVVAAELTDAAERVAAAFAAVPPDARGRTARRGDGALFTVDGLARYFLHDLVHHAHEVRG